MSTQFNVHEAKTRLSQILELVESGEEVVLARNGKPVARVVSFDQPKSIVGAGIGDPNVNAENLAKDDWWQPMTDEEIDAFIEGRY